MLPFVGNVQGWLCEQPAPTVTPICVAPRVVRSARVAVPCVRSRRHDVAPIPGGRASRRTGAGTFLSPETSRGVEERSRGRCRRRTRRWLPVGSATRRSIQTEVLAPRARRVPRVLDASPIVFHGFCK